MRNKNRWIIAAGILALTGALAACSPTTTTPDDLAGTTASDDEELYEINPADLLDMAFVFRDNNGTFERVTVELETVDEQVLVDKLIEYGVLDEGTTVKSFKIKETELDEDAASAGPGGPGGPGGKAVERYGTLDLSQVPEWTAEKEALMLKCIGNTYVDNFQLDGLRLLVNGKNYSGASITLGDDDYLEYESGYENVSE